MKSFLPQVQEKITQILCKNKGLPLKRLVSCDEQLTTERKIVYENFYGFQKIGDKKFKSNLTKQILKEIKEKQKNLLSNLSVLSLDHVQSGDSVPIQEQLHFLRKKKCVNNYIIKKPNKQLFIRKTVKNNKTCIIVKNDQYDIQPKNSSKIRSKKSHHQFISSQNVRVNDKKLNHTFRKKGNQNIFIGRLNLPQIIQNKHNTDRKILSQAQKRRIIYEISPLKQISNIISQVDKKINKSFEQSKKITIYSSVNKKCISVSKMIKQMKLKREINILIRDSQKQSKTQLFQKQKKSKRIYFNSYIITE